MLVPLGRQLQESGGAGASAPGGAASGSSGGGSAGVGGVGSAGSGFGSPAAPPLDPPPLPEPDDGGTAGVGVGRPAPPIPAEGGVLPPQEQLCCSTHSNPAPQSEAWLQPRLQRGTHWLYSVSVHSAGAGASHSRPGSHAGASPVHSLVVRVRHTMSTSQSESLLHGSGTHASVVASHGGHIASGAQSISGQPKATVSQA
jgi:hypothetical protein